MELKDIANYQITKLLGRGGMAEVYEAVDTKNRKNVALKLLLPHLAAEEVVCKRFLREAKVGMELDHPGIVRVFDVGKAEGRPYIAMELVPGKTLEDLLKTKCFDLEQCIGMALKITDALAAAHAKKIVHRDIKPRNIMVADAGVKIMDFGLARILETSSITDQHEIIGTLYYMSPEQAIGIKVDESSDVFSLGIVLYQMLTGQLPFSGEHPGAIIHAILYSDPLRIDELGKTIPLELEQIIFKTLKKKPQLRYRTAAELHTDLSKMHYVLQGQPIQLLATDEVFEESPRGIYSQLIGREAEMAALEAALENMLQGENSVILVSGEAGIGKSRLVWELGRKAKEKQARYLLGRCLFGERGYPYQPIIEVLRDYFKLKGIKDADAVDAFIEERASHLSTRKGIIQSVLLLRPGEPITLINKEQLWDTILELVKVMAQDRPVVLHFDDLHWADSSTLNLFNYLSMTTRQEPVFIIATYRPEELIAEEGKRHPLQLTLDMLGKENICQEVKLNRLDKPGTQSVVNSVFPSTQFPDNFYDTVYEETEGNPLFVLEVLRYFQDEGFVDKDETGWHLTGELARISIPNRVTDVITNRLQKLNQENRDILDVAAVEGYTFHADTICHVLHTSRLKILRHLHTLESEHHLIHALEREYQFDHGKIQESIYKALMPELAQEYHQLIADYFIKYHGSKDDHAGKIADHLIEAKQNAHALDYLLRAGQYAQKLYANEEALKKFDTAIEIADEILIQNPSPDLKTKKLEILKAKAGLYIAVDSYDNASKQYHAVVELSKQINNQRSLAHGLNGIGHSLIRKSEYTEGINWCNRALEIQKQIGDQQGTAQSLLNIGLAHWQCGYMDKALEYYNQALKISKEIGDEILKADCMKRIGATAHILADYQKAVDYGKEALTIFADSPYHNDTAECLHLIALNHTFLGNYDEALTYAEEGIVLCKQIGNKFYEAWCYLDEAFSYRGLGEYTTAIDLCKRAFEIFSNIKSGWGQARALAFETWVLSEFDDYQNLLISAQKGLDLCRRVGDKTIELSFLAMIAYARTGLCHYDIAGELFGQIEAVIKNAPIVRANYINLYTKFWFEIGDITKLSEIIKEFKDMYEKIGSRIMNIDYHIAAGKLALMQDSPNEAMQYAVIALNSSKNIRHARGTVESLMLAAKIKAMQKNYEAAARDVQEGMMVATRAERQKDVSELHLIMSRLFLHKENFPEAETHANEALQAAGRSSAQTLLWQAHHMLAKVYMKQRKQKEAKIELKKAKEVFDLVIDTLGDELKKIYLKRQEVKEFRKDLRALLVNQREEEENERI